jgi:thymidylate kinase
MQSQIATFLDSVNAVGIKISATPGTRYTEPVKCFIRNNPDGTIRWIWPSSSKTVGFLKFYHTTGLKAKVFAWICQLLVRVGLQSLMSHAKIELYIPAKSSTGVSMQNVINWAYFSGTIGPNRKAVVWKLTGSNRSQFYKIPLTFQAADNIRREFENINEISRLQLTGLVLPVVEMFPSGILSQSDIGDETIRKNRIADIPASSLHQLLTAGLSEDRNFSFGFTAEIARLLKVATSKGDDRIADTLFDKLRLMLELSKQSDNRLCAIAHGDFTPWNTMINGDKLHLIDWEMGKRQMPVLYDLFHFVYQSNILIGNRGYMAIRAELDALFSKPEWKKFIAEHKINVTDAEQWYLTYTVAYYLNLYASQPKWHLQVQWLLTTWNEAMSYFIEAKDLMPVRKIVLTDLSFFLHGKNYGVLKWRNTTLDSLPEGSDIDICISKKDALQLISALKGNPLLSITCLKNRSHMFQVQMILTDGSLLHLDLLHQFKRRSMIFMNAQKVMLSATKNEFGFKVPLPEHDFSYTWMFYWLNKAEVPQHYRDKFMSLSSAEQFRITKYVEANYFHTIDDFSELFNLKKGHRRALVHQLRSANENRGFQGLYNIISYLTDVVKNEFPHKGFIVTFSGVDGAGKSTVIENIRQMADKVLRQKVVVLRHRPSLLPIISSYKYGKQNAELRSAQNLPRQGTNINTISSLLRFAYYYSDYLFGQFYIHMRYVRRGYIVLYDRYYFDFINDGRRSNINLSPAFTKWWYRFLIQPKLNFFLYADEATILNRKQELKSEDIRQLTGSYMRLFDQLSVNAGKSKYIALENKILPDTVNAIFYQIKKQAV